MTWRLFPVVIVMAMLADTGYRHYRNLSRQLTEANAKIEGFEEAARIQRVYLDKLRQDNARWDELTRELDGLDGKDASLSDYLRNASGRVWP